MTSITTRVIDSLLKWKALPYYALRYSSGIENYPSFVTAVNRLKKDGFLKTAKLNTATHEKLIYPTSKMLSEYKDEQTLTIEERQIIHDALVSSFCLGMLKKETFTEAEIEDRLIGDDLYSSFRQNYPDAILIGNFNKSRIEVPVELELTQKSTTRIIEKFKNYLNHDYYRSVIFVFDSERIAKKYISILDHKNFLHHKEKAEGRFVFTWGSRESIAHLKIDDLEVYSRGELFKLRNLW